MYAYQQQKTANRLHVVPDRKRASNVVIKHSKKKSNPVKDLFRMLVVFSFLAAFMYFVFPTSYGRLINNVFFQRAVPINTGEPANMAVKKWSKPVAADMYSIANPVTNYLSNDMFKNRLLLTIVVGRHFQIVNRNKGNRACINQGGNKLLKITA